MNSKVLRLLKELHEAQEDKDCSTVATMCSLLMFLSHRLGLVAGCHLV